MAQTQAHFSFAATIAVAYAFCGLFLFDVAPELVLLSAVLVTVTGLLPNIDTAGGPSSRELAGLLSAVAPLVVLELYPVMKTGGVARITLVVVCCYLLTRIVVVRLLQKVTVHRGMIHSIPASIIVFELCYMLFYDLHWFDRMYVAAGAFVGFFSHLLLDGYGNLDLVGQAMGKATKKQPALKFFSGSTGTNLAWYGTMIVLGWFVLRDMYPHLKIYAGVKY